MFDFFLDDGYTRYIYIRAFCTQRGVVMMAKPLTFDALETAFQNPALKKSALQRFGVEALRRLCEVYGIPVKRSGKRGASIKIDYVNALWDKVRSGNLRWQ